MHIYIYMHKYIYIYMHIHIYIYAYICIYIYMHIYICIYVYICIYIYTHVYLFISTHTIAYNYAYTHAHLQYIHNHFCPHTSLTITLQLYCVQFSNLNDQLSSKHQTRLRLSNVSEKHHVHNKPSPSHQYFP